ncbi:hypothetical protein QR680_016859 [Steinernema hermaphroditum]|uniref:RING-type domain-containing protein n=1 Tax=Steinernema hermaphroditum TaxID=289476 RepID=A0AA39LN04_9BILA|nr:hypothetical protein QR680_016859 [Steinernema hermaphroditum]
MSGDEVSEKHCPLCMENLELDDQNFYPCKCGYQVCSFCWHRLRTDGNGLCPACRQAYPEVPASFKSIKAGKQQKDSNKQRKAPSKSEQTIRELSAYRVLQMNLIYVTGLSPRIADVDTLKKNEFFGQFGKILKLSISNGNGGSANLSSACAYVTYAKGEEALRAIQTFHNTVIDGRNIKVSLGTTKYCASFLRNLPCPKVGCSYCHELADMEISFTAEDMQQGKHSEYEKRLLEQFERKTAASTAQPAQAPSVTVERKIADHLAPHHFSHRAAPTTEWFALHATQPQNDRMHSVRNDTHPLTGSHHSYHRGASTTEWLDQRTAPPQNDRVSSLRKAAEEPHPLSESVRRCPKVGRSYCHELADMEISFTAEDMQQGKHSEYEKRLLEQFERKTAASTAQPAQAPSVTVERKIADHLAPHHFSHRAAPTTEWFALHATQPQNDRMHSVRNGIEDTHPLTGSHHPYHRGVSTTEWFDQLTAPPQNDRVSSLRKAAEEPHPLSESVRRCPKVGRSYCHELADMEISFTAEDMQQGKHSEYEKRLLEQFERKTAASTAQPAQAPSMTVERKIADHLAPHHFSHRAAPTTEWFALHATQPQNDRMHSVRNSIEDTHPLTGSHHPYHRGASTIEWFDQRTAPPQNDRVSSLRKAAEEPHPLSESVRRLSMLAEQHSAQERESRCSRVVNDSRNESQAGLRALLPNVNVRFVEQRESQSLGQFHKVVCDRQAGTPLADAPLSTSPRFEASISRFFQSFENSSNRAIPIPPGFTHLFQR